MTNGHGRSTGGFGMSRDETVQLIVDTAIANGVTDHRQIAYMLATAQHETRNFDAPEEDFGRSQARRYGYRGGEEYYGRGFVHLTHQDNYATMDRVLGLDGRLVADPSLATDPEIAARALVIGMRDGHYTSRRLDRYINEESVDYYNARRTVNGIDRREWTIKAAENTEQYAREWVERIPELVESARRRGVQEGVAVSAPERTVNPGRDVEPRAAFSDGMFNTGDRGIGVETLQRQLIEAGYTGRDGKALVADGHFGANTEHAVRELQYAHRLQVDGKAGLHTLRALADELQHGRPMRDAAPVQPAPESSFRPQRPDETSRFHDRLYDALRTGVHDMDRSLGRTPDDASDRVAAALYAQCKACGMTQIDGVVLGQKGTKAEPGEYVFAYRGQPDRVSDWVSVRTAEAIQTPVEQSVARAQALQREQGLEAQQVQAQQRSEAQVRTLG